MLQDFNLSVSPSPKAGLESSREHCTEQVTPVLQNESSAEALKAVVQSKNQFTEEEYLHIRLIRLDRNKLINLFDFYSRVCP